MKESIESVPGPGSGYQHQAYTSLHFNFNALGKPQKIRSFFSGLATKLGGGVRAWPLRKNTFFKSSKKMSGKKFVASKL